MQASNQKSIDTWFPCATVDIACGTPAGSGKNEKAIFTWFASRPIAQARAAVATALLPDDPKTRSAIEAALLGDENSIDELSAAISAHYPDGRPVVLDVFSASIHRRGWCRRELVVSIIGDLRGVRESPIS